MILKNSFLASLVENGKRRLWLLVVSLLVFVIAIPTYTAMNLSILSDRYEVVESEKLSRALYNFASRMYNASNGIVFFLIAVFAAMCAIQGFSYLYDRNKVDFYHSKPIKAITRFFSIWTNGILVFIVPYLIGTLLNLVLFAVNDILDVNLFRAAWIYVLLALFFYMGIYHIAILAVMLTGKLGVSCLGIVVLLAYEVCIRALLWVCYETFYRFYYSKNEALTTWVKPVLSPITYLLQYGSGKWNLSITVLALSMFAAGVLFIALWCYQKRPTELAGSAMTFSAIKPIIKIGIAVPAALFVGIWTADMVGYYPSEGVGNPGFPLFIGTLAVLVVCGLIQVIYEADIKGIFHKKAEILIAFVLTLGIALFFRFDVSGFDSRIPKMEDVEYATILTESGERWNRIYLDEKYKWCDKEEYISQYMKLTGDDAEAVRNLMAEAIALYGEYPTRDSYYKAYDEFYYVVFDFCMKNGKHITREIPIATREKKIWQYVEQIEKAEDFIRANEPAMSEYLLAAAMSGDWKIHAQWGGGFVQEKMNSEQALEFLRAYRQDLLNNNYEAKTSALPVGEFSFSIEPSVSLKEDLDFYGRNVQCLVYPGFTNSIACLNKNGFETQQLVHTEDIDKIVVSRDYDSRDGDEVFYQKEYVEATLYYEETVAYSENVSVTESIAYTEQDRITDILEASHLESIGVDRWYVEEPYDYTYRIRIYLKQNSPYYDEYDEFAHSYFIKGQVPDFIKKDLPDDKKIEE